MTQPPSTRVKRIKAVFKHAKTAQPTNRIDGSNVPTLPLSQLDNDCNKSKSITVKQVSTDRKTFKMCCLVRSDKPKEPKQIHFHECEGLSHNRRISQNACTLGNEGGRIFTPLELTVEAAKARVIKDTERFLKI